MLRRRQKRCSVFNGEDAMIVRRQMIRLAAGLVASPLASRLAGAQAYPTRPIRLLVGFAPGGGNDIVGRLIGQWLSDHLGQPIVVENRPGASTNIATESVVRSPPDGYTLLFCGVSSTINATLYENLSFNFMRDIAPVASLIDYPSVMVVHPSVATKTVAEFLAYAKANPGKLSMSSAGNGSVGHLSGELLRMMTGVELQHVPYRGNAPALADLLSSQVAVTFASSASAAGYLKSGKLRALAVTSATRSETMPDIPAMAEFVPGFEVASWYGIAAPQATPAAVIDRLNQEVNSALADSDMKARLAELGGTVIPSSPADFGRRIASDTDKWAKVIKFAGVKLT
jgi:tripartite-type tricarboxylate transporter receptor subunit TctC